MFQNVIPWKFWNNIPLGGKYTVKILEYYSTVGNIHGEILE